MTKCPYCKKELRDQERYCDFCEQDIGKTVDEAEKPEINPNPADVKAGIINLKEKSKAVFRNIKKIFKK